MPGSLNSIGEVKVAVTKGDPEIIKKGESVMSTEATVTVDGLISETVKSFALASFAVPPLLIDQLLNVTSVRVTVSPGDTVRLIVVVQ